jgi:PAS domain S-box-containing protein
MEVEDKYAEWNASPEEPLFRAIFMAMDEGALLHDEDGKVVAVNPAAEGILGLVAADWIGRSSSELLQALNFMLEDGTPLSCDLCSAKLDSRIGNTQRNVRVGAYRPDGTLVWLSINPRPLISDGKSVPYAVVTTFRDVTAHKRTEQYERFRSETLELLSGGTSLQGVLEGIVQGVEQLNPEMICSILLLDGKGERLDKCIAQKLPDFYTAAIDGIEIGLGVGCCGRAAATGERVIVDDISTHPYWASYKEVAARAGLAACWSEPIRSSTGRVLGTFAVYHREKHFPSEFDISVIEKSARLVSIAVERKRNEAEIERHRHHLEKLVEDRTLALTVAKESAEAATRAKTHFLAAASHDLRQPLQAIQLFNDSLTQTSLNEEQKRISGYLSTAVNSLGELLNDLLDLSRLDAGATRPQRAVIQAESLLGTIGAEFDAVSREKNISLNLFCPGQDLALFSDPHLLLTMLRNLVSNAVKYTARGRVLVAIRRRDGYALIQVWDTGIGIAWEQMDSIFEEYFQIGNPERDRAKGVGLGLSIVRRLSTLLDIGVNLRSREGRGSVFELSVPLANDSDKLAASVHAAANPRNVASDRLAGKRIVLIEDDPTAGESIRLSLEMKGAHITLFASAEDALGNPTAMGADYYICDYRLPGMNGLQLLDAIQRDSAKRVRAVLLTGTASPDQILRMQSSRWKVLFKPIGLPTLLSALDTHETVY